MAIIAHFLAVGVNMCITFLTDFPIGSSIYYVPLRTFNARKQNLSINNMTYTEYLKKTGRFISEAEYHGHDCGLTEEDSCIVCERYFAQVVNKIYA